MANSAKLLKYSKEDNGMMMCWKNLAMSLAWCEHEMKAFPLYNDTQLVVLRSKCITCFEITFYSLDIMRKLKVKTSYDAIHAFVPWINLFLDFINLFLEYIDKITLIWHDQPKDPLQAMSILIRGFLRGSYHYFFGGGLRWTPAGHQWMTVCYCSENGILKKEPDCWLIIHTSVPTRN